MSIGFPSLQYELESATFFNSVSSAGASDVATDKLSRKLRWICNYMVFIPDSYVWWDFYLLRWMGGVTLKCAIGNLNMHVWNLTGLSTWTFSDCQENGWRLYGWCKVGLRVRFSHGDLHRAEKPKALRRAIGFACWTRFGPTIRPTGILPDHSSNDWLLVYDIYMIT